MHYTVDPQNIENQECFSASEHWKVWSRGPKANPHWYLLKHQQTEKQQQAKKKPKKDNRRYDQQSCLAQSSWHMTRMDKKVASSFKGLLTSTWFSKQGIPSPHPFYQIQDFRTHILVRMGISGKDNRLKHYVVHILQGMKQELLGKSPFRDLSIKHF